MFLFSVKHITIRFDKILNQHFDKRSAAAEDDENLEVINYF